MQIQEIMTDRVVAVDDSATVQFAAGLMESNGVGCLPVVRNNEPVGIVTDRDIAVRVVARAMDPAQTRVGSAMTPGLVECQATTEVEVAAELMQERGVRRLVIMDHGVMIGLVSVDDLARRMADNGMAGLVLKAVAETTRHPRAFVRQQLLM